MHFTNHTKNMGEALRDKADQYTEILSTVIGLREHWLNPIRADNPKTVELTKSEEGILRLRGYVRDENPDMVSLEYNAFVGIAFVGDQIIAEIHYPFSTRITTFIALDTKTNDFSAHKLTDYKSMQIEQELTLDESDKLETLFEFANYFERLTNFSIPYETQYARDIENIGLMREAILEIFKIRPYVFETEALK